MFKRLFAAALFLISISSCKKESLAPAPPSFNYFPTERGMFIIYNVDSIYHADNDNNNDDSVYALHFQVKEVIDSSFVDEEGRTSQVIIRYRRATENDDWILQNIWTQTLSSSTAYKTEHNLPYHKMSFPINSKTTWNGNDMNTLDEETYSYESFHVPLTLNSIGFDSTLTVLQRDDDNYIEQIYAEEIYANHIGMIYKERDDLRKTAGLVVTGTEYKMTVAGYGQE